MDRQIDINQLEQDPQNARKRTARSSSLIRESLDQFGPLRSLVGEKLPNGKIRIRAGNGTLEEAQKAGIQKVRIIERDPGELVVVVADGLDETQWRQYAIADNRTSDLSEWDVDILQEIGQQIDLDPWFTEEEIAGWDTGIQGYSEDEPESSTQEIDPELYEFDCKCPKCGFEFTKTNL
jgi:ParB-like chromosome segregation protein Spo0J